MSRQRSLRVFRSQPSEIGLASNGGKGEGKKPIFNFLLFLFLGGERKRGGKEFLIGLLKAELVDLDSTSTPTPLPPKKFLRTRSGQNL